MARRAKAPTQSPPAPVSQPIGELLKQIAAKRTQAVAAQTAQLVAQQAAANPQTAGTKAIEAAVPPAGTIAIPPAAITGLEHLLPFVGIDPLATALVKSGFTQQERVEILVRIIRDGSDKDKLKAERSLQQLIDQTLERNGGYATLTERKEHVGPDGTITTRTTQLQALRSALSNPIPSGGSERIIDPVKAGPPAAGAGGGSLQAGSPVRPDRPDARTDRAEESNPAAGGDGGGSAEAPPGDGHQERAAGGPEDSDRVGAADADRADAPDRPVASGFDPALVRSRFEVPYRNVGDRKA